MSFSVTIRIDVTAMCDVCKCRAGETIHLTEEEVRAFKGENLVFLSIDDMKRRIGCKKEAFLWADGKCGTCRIKAAEKDWKENG